MKKIFFVFVCGLFSLGLLGQVPKVNQNVYGVRVKNAINRAIDTVNATYIDVSAVVDTNDAQTVILNTHETRLDDFDLFADSVRDGDLGGGSNWNLIDSTGWVNAEGFITAAGGDEQEAIQMAVDYAATLGENFYEPSVYVPNTRTWNFSDQSVILKEGVRIVADENTLFYMDNPHSIDAFFVNPADDHLSFCGVTGGQYVGYSTQDWSVFKAVFDTTTEYAHAVRFDKMFIRNSGAAFDIYCDSSGWFNANTFSDIWTWNAKSFLKGRQTGVGSGLAGNHFLNINVQAGDSTEAGIDTLQGGSNLFQNINLWDWQYGVPGRIGITLDAGGNSIEGYLPREYFEDISTNTRNYVRSTWGMFTPIHDSLRIHSYTYGDWANSKNRLTISGNGVAGSGGSPNYNAIKMYGPDGTPGAHQFTGSNSSIRLMGGNEAGANYSSHFKVQVHGSSSDEGEDAYIDALYIDGSDAGDVTFIRAIIVTPSDTATATEGSIYYDSDTDHFYGRNASSWVQLDN